MKRVISIFWKIVLVTFAVFVGELIIGGVVHKVMGPVWENSPPFSELALPMFVGVLITVSALVYPTLKSTLRGWRLFLALFLVLFGLNVFLLNIEGAIFLLITPPQLISTVLVMTATNVLLALLMVAAFGLSPIRPSSAVQPKRLTAAKWLTRILLVSVCYMLLYFSAGLLIIPFVRDFYETQNVPTGAWFMPFQILRGAGYILFTLYLVRSISGSRWHCSISMGLLFPVIAGVAGLLSPNGIMPDHVRYWHILEIGWSNLVYGMIVGYVFWTGGNPGKASRAAVFGQSEKTGQLRERPGATSRMSGVSLLTSDCTGFQQSHGGRWVQ
jgi:hypothetical protein